MVKFPTLGKIFVIGLIIIKVNRVLKGNQKVLQKLFYTHCCLDGLSSIEDWDFALFEHCKTRETEGKRNILTHK